MTTMTAIPLQLRRARLREQLEIHAARLARRNQDLEHFAALVAHIVRSSLVALKCDEPRGGLAPSLEVVGVDGANQIVAPGGPLAMHSDALRVALPKLFANAVAAEAGLGLWLCRRLIGRFDPSRKLASGPAGGNWAMIVAQRAV